MVEAVVDQKSCCRALILECYSKTKKRAERMLPHIFHFRLCIRASPEYWRFHCSIRDTQLYYLV